MRRRYHLYRAPGDLFRLGRRAIITGFSAAATGGAFLYNLYDKSRRLSSYARSSTRSSTSSRTTPTSVSSIQKPRRQRQYTQRHPTVKFYVKKKFKMPKRRRTSSKTAQNYATISDVRREITRKQEKKYLLTNQVDVGMSFDVPLLVSLCDIAQGDGDSERDGDSCQMKSVQIRGRTNASHTDAQFSRILLFQWLQDTVPTLNQVILAGTPDAHAVFEPYNHDRRHQFRILYDKTFVHGDNTNNDNRPTVYFFSAQINIGLLTKRFKMKNELRFQAAGTAATNKIYALGFSDASNAAAYRPTVMFSAKLNFVDS